MISVIIHIIPKAKGVPVMLVIGAIFVDVKGFSLGTYHP